MKRIKQNNKHQQRASMKNSTKFFWSSLSGILILAILVLVAIESMADGVIVRNKSSEKLEYVKAYFVDMEGLVTDDEILFENIESGDNSKLPLEKVDLLYREANLEVRFKFENHDEMFVDAGYFNDMFDGHISISFDNSDDDDKLLLKVKAKSGLFKSLNIDCDEEHIVNLATGEIEE